jgi:hypothetical protein
VRVLCIALVLIGGAAFSWAAETPPTAYAARAALERATRYLVSIAVHGGYVWRYRPDMTYREGEVAAKATDVWVQAPGTQSVGEAFLDAYVATGDQLHFDAAAGAVGALLLGQLQSGGWDYTISFAPDDRARSAYRANGKASSKRQNVTTLDDDTTQGALRFLMRFLHLAEERGNDTRSVRSAILTGLASMLAAQYPNGAWPQVYSGKAAAQPGKRGLPATIPDDWPRIWPDRDYASFYTLNDNTQADCIRTMLAAWKQFGDPRYRDAALRGGEFLLQAQLPAPQAAWAQQYDFAMHPAWARPYEPPALASAESAAAARALVDLYAETGDERFLAAVPPFLAWLERSEIAPGRWARLYELGTNRPLYGDRDGRLHYALNEISAERQSDYAWEGTFGIPSFRNYYDLIRSVGRSAYLAGAWERLDRPPPEPNVITALLAQQDSSGRWISDGWIDMESFTAKMDTLAAYLRAQ